MPAPGMDPTALRAYDNTPAGRDSRRLNQEQNAGIGKSAIQLPDIDLTPKYYLYIFNLRDFEYVIEHGTHGRIVIPACKPGEPYSQPVAIPSVNLYVTTNMNGERQVLPLDIVSGERVVRSIINPGDGGVNTDLTQWGCFVSRSKTPSEEEISEARKKLEATYNRELIEARKKEAMGKIGDITNTEREAAGYFKLPYSWNQVSITLNDCPGCGSPVKPGIIIHSCGYVFDWKRAVEHGLKKKSDVPEAFQWWKIKMEEFPPDPIESFKQ